MRPARWPRVALLLLGVVALVTGIAGGLARMGAPPLIATAGAFHGGLMVSGFLGTVISLERAIAFGGRLALATPLASGLGTLAMLAGWYPLGTALWIVAPLGLIATSIGIVRRQSEVHTVLLAVAAACWGVGNAAFLVRPGEAVMPWWFAFLVLTIAAERLEMTRLTRRPAAAQPLFLVLVAALLAACAAYFVDAAAGRIAFGVTLAALAAWLAAFDIARRTVRREGLARYAAIALLAGYAWLAAGGIVWAFVPALRDFALHALGLGFVFSMIFAHAPIVVPVVARTPMRFTPLFYAPLALLHATVLLRLAAGGFDPALRLWGGALNAVAIALFVATVLWSVRRRSAPPEAR